MANDTDLIILDGRAFFYSSPNGDVGERAPSGFSRVTTTKRRRSGSAPPS